LSPYLVYILSVIFSINSSTENDDFLTLHSKYYDQVYSYNISSTDTAGFFTKVVLDSSGIMIDDLVTLAKNYLGYPYVWAGTTEKGFDCSGFMYFLFQKMGTPIPRMPADQCLMGEDIRKEDVRKGDMIFFKGRNIYSNWIGHVGLAIEPDSDGVARFIHAENPRTGVRIDRLDHMYYGPRFIRATRLYYANNPKLFAEKK